MQKRATIIEVASTLYCSNLQLLLEVLFELLVELLALALHFLLHLLLELLDLGLVSLLEHDAAEDRGRNAERQNATKRTRRINNTEKFNATPPSNLYMYQIF